MGNGLLIFMREKLLKLWKRAPKHKLKVVTNPTPGSLLTPDKAALTSANLVNDEAIDTVFTKQYGLKTPLALNNGELN